MGDCKVASHALPSPYSHILAIVTLQKRWFLHLLNWVRHMICFSGYAEMSRNDGRSIGAKARKV